MRKVITTICLMACLMVVVICFILPRSTSRNLDGFTLLQRIQLLEMDVANLQSALTTQYPRAVSEEVWQRLNLPPSLVSILDEEAQRQSKASMQSVQRAAALRILASEPVKKEKAKIKVETK